MKFFMAAVISTALLASCAQFSDEIVPLHSSTSSYNSFSCSQIELEANRVSQEYSTYALQQDKLANRDASLALASMFVVTAPASFFMTGGNGPLAEEVADLRGQLVALEKVNIRKNCRIQFDELQ